VLLLVLAIVWGVLLVSWLRSRSGGVLSDSVGAFRRHLTVLERATPTRVAPANSLYTRARGSHAIPAYRSAAMPQRLGSPAPARPGRYPDPSALRRRQAQRRRRDVLLALMVGASGSFLLALIPGMSVMWTVQILFDVLLIGYIAMLVHMRNLGVERQMKVSYLPQTRRPLPAGRPVPRSAYDFGGQGYDLDFRRAAN
jgi:hypothetical protein